MFSKMKIPRLLSEIFHSFVANLSLFDEPRFTKQNCLFVCLFCSSSWGCFSFAAVLRPTLIKQGDEREARGQVGPKTSSEASRRTSPSMRVSVRPTNLFGERCQNSSSLR
jgi:hypothetical protein